MLEHGAKYCVLNLPAHNKSMHEQMLNRMLCSNFTCSSPGLQSYRTVGSVLCLRSGHTGTYIHRDSSVELSVNQSLLDIQTWKTTGINHYYTRHVEHLLTGASCFPEVQFRGSQSSTADYTLGSFPWQPKRFEIVGSPLGEEWNMILIFLSALQPYIPTPAAFLMPCLRYGITMSGMCAVR